MTTLQVVIGGAYGDEGKGLVTDALVAAAHRQGQEALVVRFNGGAQAGHTVTTPDGHRHVFHHLGSGALAGAPTHLAQRFVVHPMLFAQEHAHLKTIGANTYVTVDPRARLTLPFDVMINQAIERQRGHERHGSCGVGFGETCQRNESHDPRHALTVGDLARMTYGDLESRWNAIVHGYVPQRLAQLGLPPDALGELHTQAAVLERFVDDCTYFLDHAILAKPASLKADAFVLEGAQGLALDENLGAFPYVTRSKTGLPWALEFLNQAVDTVIPVTAWYLTRAYTTRHGAGPLPHEQAWAPPGFDDPTNQPNAFQGTLRLAPLDVDALAGRIQQDLQRSSPWLAGRPVATGISVSCLDQMGPATPLADGPSIPTTELGLHVSKAIGAQHRLESWGPTRETVSIHCPPAPEQHPRRSPFPS
jgi:adenylosuccinate synthase